jgi:hypothetical protein
MDGSFVTIQNKSEMGEVCLDKPHPALLSILPRK